MRKRSVFVIVVLVVSLIGVVYWSLRPTRSSDIVDLPPLSLLDEAELTFSFPGIGHGMTRVTLNNGTHLIDSILLFEVATNEIVAQDHVLIKIDGGVYTIIGIYKDLKDVPNYQSFIQNSGESPT